MNLGIEGRKAFIAGSSDGIGRGIAEALAAEGCEIVLCARGAEKLERVVEELKGRSGHGVHSVTADLDSAEDIDRAVSRVLTAVGHIDILVTNNGGPPTGTFDQLNEAQWTGAWNRTFLSAVRLIRGFLDGMKNRRWGRVIGVTSISVKQPIHRLILSNSYRAGVTGMMKTLSQEVAAYGITVNTIAPGYIETARMTQLFAERSAAPETAEHDEREALIRTIPAGHLGTPADIGALAAFLASEQAHYITGTTILVDGGMYKGLM